MRPCHTLLSALVTLLYALNVAAQSGDSLCLEGDGSSRLEFSTLTHDFGTIDEGGGDVYCNVVARNISDTPVVISGAITNCSCITVRRNRKPIAPQATDTLRITFDPRFKVGSLQKTILIRATGAGNAQESWTLTLTGNVTPRGK